MGLEEVSQAKGWAVWREKEQRAKRYSEHRVGTQPAKQADPTLLKTETMKQIHAGKSLDTSGVETVPCLVMNWVVL